MRNVITCLYMYTHIAVMINLHGLHLQEQQVSQLPQQVSQLPGTKITMQLTCNHMHCSIVVLEIREEVEVFSKLKPHQFSPEGKYN